MMILLSNKNECGNFSDTINDNNRIVMVMDEGAIGVMVTVEMWTIPYRNIHIIKPVKNNKAEYKRIYWITYPISIPYNDIVWLTMSEAI